MLLRLSIVSENSLAEETIHLSTTFIKGPKVECMQRYERKYEFGCFQNQNYGDVQSLTELLNFQQLTILRFLFFSMIVLVQALANKPC